MAAYTMPSKAASPRLVHVCFLLAVLFINLVTKVASEGFYECVPGLNANPGGKYNAITNVLSCLESLLYSNYCRQLVLKLLKLIE